MRLQMDQRNSGAQVGNPKSERASLAVTKIANWISPWITNYSIGSALVVHVVCLCPVPSTNCYHLVTSSSSSLSVSSLLDAGQWVLYTRLVAVCTAVGWNPPQYLLLVTPLQSANNVHSLEAITSRQYLDLNNGLKFISNFLGLGMCTRPFKPRPRRDRDRNVAAPETLAKTYGENHWTPSIWINQLIRGPM